MTYVLVDNKSNSAEIYKDATQIAHILGVSVSTIWYHKKKTAKIWGNYTLHYVPEGVKKSNRGRK